MAATAVSVHGQASVMDVVSHTNDDGVKKVFIVDDVLPATPSRPFPAYILVNADTGAYLRSDLMPDRWVFGS